jgi:hypothetical protein
MGETMCGGGHEIVPALAMERPNLPETAPHSGRERRRWAITPEELAILVDLFGGRMQPFGNEDATRFPLRGCRARLSLSGEGDSRPAPVDASGQPLLAALECDVTDVSMREVGVEAAELTWPTDLPVVVEILHPALQPRRWSTRLIEWSPSVSGRWRATLRFEPPPALPS